MQFEITKEEIRQLKFQISNQEDQYLQDFI